MVKLRAYLLGILAPFSQGAGVYVGLSWLFLFAALCVVRFAQGWGAGLTTLPITLTIDWSDTAQVEMPEVAILDRKGKEIALTYVNGCWVIEDYFVSGLRMRFTLRAEERVRSVHVSVGQKTYDISREQFIREWPKTALEEGHSTFQSTHVTESRSVLPFMRHVWNWPGDETVLKNLLIPSAFRAFLGTILALLALPLIPLALPKHREGSDPRTIRRVAFLCLLAALAYGAVFMNAAKFESGANPRGDAWEYQAIAVNMLKGHGLNRVGSIEPYETYRFQTDAMDSTDWRAVMAFWGGKFRSYRTPGYPTFLAGIYSVAGVSPLRAKQMQLVLLILAAASLPFLGFWYWKSTGFYAGIAAGLLFLEGWHHLAEKLYTESLITAMVMVFVFAFLLYRRYLNLVTAGILGCVGGIAALVKGDMIFLLPLALLALGLQAYRGKVAVSHALVSLLCGVAMVLPWSIYATHHGGHVTVLSDMAAEIMLDGNNELTLDNGKWHPEYRRVPGVGSFYNRPEIMPLSTPVKIFKFYAAYPDKFLPAMYMKLSAGFSPFIFLRLSIIFLLFHILSLLRSDTNPGGRPVWRQVGGVVLICGAAFNIVALLLLFAIALIVLGLKRRVDLLQFPTPIAIAFGNILLITLLVFGDPRFISVMDTLFMLTGLSLLFSWILRCYEARTLLMPAADTRGLNKANRDSSTTSG